MTKQTHVSIPGTLDIRALWDANGQSLGVAENTYRAWLESTGRIQTATLEFLNERVKKDLAAAAELGECKTATEALELQWKHVSETFADYLAEGQKLAEYFSEAAQEQFQKTYEGVKAAEATVEGAVKPAAKRRNGRRAS